MKSFNDGKLYLYSGIVTAVLMLVLGAISFYSICSIEPRIETLLAAKTDIGKNYARAYLLLREPQVFARYDYDILRRDSEGEAIVNIITDFDRRILSGGEIKPEEKQYLESRLLDRRKKGSRLGRNTAVFLGVLTFLLGGVFLYEKRTSA